MIPAAAPPSTNRLEPASRLTAWRLFILGLQHVLVMYAGTVSVPLIIGGALKLPKEQLAFLINADLFASGIATLVQSVGIWKFGIRLPVMMGVTFTAVSSIIALGAAPNIGLVGVYGGVIAAGLFGILIAPLMGRMLKLFPPAVTGSLITLIGLSLLGVGINWAAGGLPTLTTQAAGVTQIVPNPAYGDLGGLAIAATVLVVILILTKYGRGMLGSVAVLIGVVVGTLVAAACGKVSFHGVREASFLAVVTPFHFGLPTFHLSAIVAMCVVMLITMVESTGMFFALSEVIGRPLSQKELLAGLRADGLGTVIGGIFNTFPYTSFSQNVGLVTMTGVRSHRVAVPAGLILMGLGLFPKLAHIVASVPQCVLGGAGIVMFGTVAAVGIRILGSIDYDRSRHDLFIVALSIGIGLIPTLAPSFFQHLPQWTGPFTRSGIVLGTLVAVLLNLLFNGLEDKKASESQ